VRAAYVASLVGIPLEVDKNNLRRWDYVRVKIGCRDVSKVPVEGLLDLHFFISISREKWWLGDHPQLGTHGQEMLTGQMKTIPHPRRQEKGKESTFSREVLVEQRNKKIILNSSMVGTKEKVV
jgi:hypothetical protein